MPDEMEKKRGRQRKGKREQSAICGRKR